MYFQELKDEKWGRKAERGDMRWARTDDILCLQWKDSKPVSMCSTFHCANDTTIARRNSKGKDGKYVRLELKKPKAVDDYNQNMGGVDRSDQLLASYDVLLKSYRWWKTLFFHMVDLAVVNSYILFQAVRERYPDEPLLQRSGSNYS